MASAKRKEILASSKCVQGTVSPVEPRWFTTSAMSGRSCQKDGGALGVRNSLGVVRETRCMARLWDSGLSDQLSTVHETGPRNQKETRDCEEKKK